MAVARVAPNRAQGLLQYGRGKSSRPSNTARTGLTSGTPAANPSDTQRQQVVGGQALRLDHATVDVGGRAKWPRPNEEKLLDQSYPALLKTMIIFGLYSPLAGQSGLV